MTKITIYDELDTLLNQDSNTEHIKTIDWLINEDNIGQGRSYLLASRFIILAFNQPEKRINFWDHYPFSSGKAQILNLMLGILNSRPLLKKNFKFNQDYIVFKKIRGEK